MNHLLLAIFMATVTQLIELFGIFFVAGFVLSKLQTAISRQYARTIGWAGILWTAWIGTPIHELGHVVLATIFRHRIHRISLFQPNPNTGNLGSVEHSFNPKSLYQRIGNFFIGAAPLLFGTLFLTALLLILVPQGKEILEPFAPGASLEAFFVGLVRTFQLLFSVENLRAWHFWLFLYISFCIASHVAPSKEDRRGMWGGFFWIILLLFVLNTIAIGFQKPGLTAWLGNLNHYFGVFVGIFLYTIVLSLIHLITAIIFFAPFRIRR